MQNTKLKTRKRIDKKQLYLDALIDINCKLFKTDDKNSCREALESLACVTNSSGAYFFETSTDSSKTTFVLKNFWASEEKPQYESNILPLDNRKLEKLISGKPIFKKISRLSSSEREYFNNIGIVSYLAVPVATEDKFYGYLRFDSNEHEDNFSPADLKFLRSAAALLALALEYKNSHDRLQSSHQQLRDIFYDKINQLEKLSRAIKNNIPSKDGCAAEDKQNFYFNKFFNNTHDIVFITDLNGKFLSINNHVERITGFKRNEVISKNITDFILPQYISIFKKMLEMAQAGILNQANYEVKFKSKNDTTIHFEINNYVINDSNDRPSEILGIARDISDIKNNESKLLKLKHDFYALINSSNDALMSFKPVYDESKKIVDFEWVLINTAAEKLLDRPAGELIGRKMRSNLNDNSIESLFDRFVKAYESGIPLYYEHNYRYKDINLWLRISAIKHDDNLIMNLSDVTFHKQSEKDLQEQINFNEILLDSLPYPAMLIDSKRKILAFNKHAGGLGAAYNRDCWSLFGHVQNSHQKITHDFGSCFFCHADNCLETFNSINCFEQSHEDKFWQMNLLHVYEDIFLYFAIDVTENKKMLTQIEYADEKVRKSENVKRQFLCNMSHELRTPMNIIIGFAELLSETALEEEQTEYLRQIKTGSMNLLTIINDIIDFSNIEAERLEIQNSEFDLRDAMQDVINKNLELCKSKNLTLALKFDRHIKFNVISDSERLKQVLFNLINNAIKFTQHGKIQLCATIEPISAPPGRIAIKFEIIDEGIGISEEKIQELFSPFIQADASLTRRYGGTGLGLTISNHLVRLLGSHKIFCESVPGKGSNFYFVIEFIKGKINN